MADRDADPVEATDWISLVSIVVAAVALIVAIRAEKHARRQADAAEQDLAQQRLEHREALEEKDRQHHEALTPTLNANIQVVSDQNVLLWVELVPGSVDLDGFDVEIVDTREGELVEFAIYQNGVASDQERPRRYAVCADGLRRGERTSWRVELPEESRSPRARLRITARRGQQDWEVFTDAAVPPPGPNIW